MYWLIYSLYYPRGFHWTRKKLYCSCKGTEYSLFLPILEHPVSKELPGVCHLLGIWAWGRLLHKHGDMHLHNQTSMWYLVEQNVTGFVYKPTSIILETISFIHGTQYEIRLYQKSGCWEKVTSWLYKLCIKSTPDNLLWLSIQMLAQLHWALIHGWRKESIVL